ncbi:metal-dependent hydrolase [Methanobacterium sp.]|uniref:metal-dependent hydrolase n=1 Tax=Methanobacterium sp. TaxID=2164 RepID=UPI003C74D58B
MPSYKKHTLFSLIIAVPFIHDIFYLSLALIGASMIDMDHHIRKNDLILLTVLGILLTFSLYILKLPFLIGISLIIMAFIFYLSKHRGFTHSISGVLTLSFLLAFSIIGIYTLLHGFNITEKISLIVISIILGIITLNKKLLLPFFILVPIGIIITKNTDLNLLYVFLAVLIGSLSHILLDLFTPSGIRLFNPLSSKKFKKSSGVILFISWAFLALIYVFKLNSIVF